jgi:hypothetical protein
MNQNKQHNRSNNGKSQRKKTATSLPLKESNETTCKVRLAIGIDSLSFFVVGGRGHGIHEDHPPLEPTEMPTRKRTVPQEADTFAKKLAMKGARPGLISGVLEETHGVSWTRRQAAQSTAMAKLANDLVGAERLEAMKDLMSDTDQVFQHLKSISASYVALFHRKGPCDEMKPAAKSSNGATDCKDHGEELVIERVSEAGETIISKVNCTGTGEKNEQVMKHAASTRSIVDADDGQDVLVALVWTTPAGKRCFQAFPEQVSVDETHGTNDEEWGLLTFTIQDMSGKQETVIRCWSPNNRAWLFRWLFQTSVPSLVGAAACCRTRLIICDGDPQECSQLDDAIQVVFIRAK